jgi:hypothetical protein
MTYPGPAGAIVLLDLEKSFPRGMPEELANFID